MSIQVASTTDNAETIASVMGASAGQSTEEATEKKAAPEIKTKETGQENQGESTDESAASEEEQEDGQPRKRKGGFQKRIDKLTRRQAELESQNAALIEALRSAGKVPESKTTEEKKAPVSDGKPKAEDFESHDEYVEALTDWKVDQKLNAKESKTRETQVREEKNRQQTEFQTRMDGARNRYEDFDEVMADAEIPVSPAMEEVIMTSEVGPDIAYYLANNEEEAMKIAAMPALAAAKALGKIEDRLEAELKKSTEGKKDEKPAQETKKTDTPVTKAPKPIKPVNAGGSSGGSSKDPNEMSYQEFKAWRESGRG